MAILIASIEILSDFFQKHKKEKSSSLWALAQDKAKVVDDKRWYFSDRTSRVIDGKLMTYYCEWSDRFVEFCLYKHLMKSAEREKLISENYVSCKGKGRFYAIEKLFLSLKDFPYVFKTDVKSYFASIDTVILERIVNRIALSDPSSSPLRHLIWQNLFGPMEPSDGNFREKGIFQGSSLSSYYAWVYLKKLDDFFEDLRESVCVGGEKFSIKDTRTI